VYKDSTAVLGPLAVYADPHSWDLCEMHAARLVVPRGWDVVRLPPDPAQERADDLEALANIVRDVGRAERAAQARALAQPLPAHSQSAQSQTAQSQTAQSQSAQSQAAQSAPRQSPARPVQPVQSPPVQSQPRPRQAPRPSAAAEPVGQGVEVGRRGHLRVVRSAPTPQTES
jgi:hypothetical protein